MNAVKEMSHRTEVTNPDPPPKGVDGKPIPIRFAVKPNSGTTEDWTSIVKDAGSIAWLNSNRMYGRTEILAELKSRFGDGANEGGAVLTKHGEGIPGMDPEWTLVLTSDPAVLITTKPVLMVKMWGFAGMRCMGDPFALYRNAVTSLVYGDVGMSNGVYHMLAKGGITEYDLVLHFDGDPAAEDEDEKFTHAIFAPFVARCLRNELNVTPHLVIAKYAKKTPALIAPKFGFYASDKLKIRTVETHANQAHFYPYFDDKSLFKSISLIIQGGAESTHGSEAKTAVMMDKFFARAAYRSCLCVGGNTVGGVVALNPIKTAAASERDALERSKFDRVVRAVVVALA
jgi:hypothetical protein